MPPARSSSSALGQTAVQWLGGAVLVAVLGLVVAAGMGASAASAADDLRSVVCTLGAKAGASAPCPTFTAASADAPTSTGEAAEPPATIVGSKTFASGETPAQPRECTTAVTFGSSVAGRTGQICRSVVALFCVDGTRCDETIPRSFLEDCGLDLTSKAAVELCVVTLDDGTPAFLACGPVRAAQGKGTTRCEVDDPLGVIPAETAGCDRPGEARAGGSDAVELQWACANERGELFFCQRQVKAGTLVAGKVEPTGAECLSRTFPSAADASCVPARGARVWRCEQPGTRAPMLCTILREGGTDVAGKPLHCRTIPAGPMPAASFEPAKRCPAPTLAPTGRRLKHAGPGGTGGGTFGALGPNTALVCAAMVEEQLPEPSDLVPVAFSGPLGLQVWHPEELGAPPPPGVVALQAAAQEQWDALLDGLPPSWGPSLLMAPTFALGTFGPVVLQNGSTLIAIDPTNQPAGIAQGLAMSMVQQAFPSLTASAATGQLGAAAFANLAVQFALATMDGVPAAQAAASLEGSVDSNPLLATVLWAQSAIDGEPHPAAVPPSILFSVLGLLEDGDDFSLAALDAAVRTQLGRVIDGPAGVAAQKAFDTWLDGHDELRR